MPQPDDPTREIAELRDRLSRLSEAGLRITEDLDFNTVLQGVLDSARSLTDARYGVIALHAHAGAAEDFLSSGMTVDEAQELWTLPGWPDHFEYLGGILGPLRVPDLLGHIRSLGLPELVPPVAVSDTVSFMATPLLHRGERVGSIFLAEKERGQEFTQEDEETLALFASQAAMAIANARRHREERRARADLETLIDTSPVGVVVFDARTGVPKSFNRAAMRIVDSLRNPGQSPEDLLAVVTFRRADGQEVSLQEFPMAELLSVGETVRAEEVIISVPDGRSLTLLLNATPIVSDEGTVESMVVTMQDMADVEELERMRAEFLAMVSHELRTPLTSIKGSVTTIMDSATDIDPAVIRQFIRIIGDQADHMNALVADLLDVARIETGTLPVSPEPAEVAVLVDRARNAFKNAGGRNNLAIDVAADLPLVMADRLRIVQVLVNLLTNASRHSSESSVIRVSAVRDGIHVAVSVADEGRGIPAETLPYLFRKFSATQPEDQGGDTGLGLAICKGLVEAHGGRIWAESDGPGLGARFTFTIPMVADAGAEAGVPPAPTHSRRQRRMEPEQRVRVLAVDDDPNDLRYIRDSLARSGYSPVVTGDPDEALHFMEAEQPQIVLLDLMLPGTDGIELMKEILEIADVPVIFLSAYGREDLIVRAFDMGAVDYVVKPFSPTELAARIRSALRRRAVSEPATPYVLGDLTIDYSAHRVTLGDRQVQLTALEYRLLIELSANSGRVLTYERLLQRVWGEKNDSPVSPIRTIVGKLRRKLGDNADNPTYILTEPRVGYRMPIGGAQTEKPPSTK
ncbi:MAG: response regulator [Chloroflexota bacterium]|nr:response regulator [Chloroflexota bacterium]MDE2940809.1 response regulator [Chloroflexota bacterium]MDE3267601.1 response regulator [Chloroflexota bacterium]